jgi:hypothetical protein
MTSIYNGQQRSSSGGSSGSGSSSGGSGSDGSSGGGRSIYARSGWHGGAASAYGGPAGGSRSLLSEPAYEYGNSGSGLGEGQERRGGGGGSRVGSSSGSGGSSSGSGGGRRHVGASEHGRAVIRQLVEGLPTTRLDRVLVFLELAAAETATENRAALVRRFRTKVDHDQALTDSFDSFLRGGAMTESLLESVARSGTPIAGSGGGALDLAHSLESPGEAAEAAEAAGAPSSSSSSSSSSSALPPSSVSSLSSPAGTSSTGVATTVGCDDDFGALSDAARAAELLLAVRSAAPRHLGAYQRSPAHLRLGHVFENLRDMSHDAAEVSQLVSEQASE